MSNDEGKETIPPPARKRLYHEDNQLACKTLVSMSSGILVWLALNSDFSSSFCYNLSLSCTLKYLTVTLPLSFLFVFIGSSLYSGVLFLSVRYKKEDYHQEEDVKIKHLSRQRRYFFIGSFMILFLLFSKSGRLQIQPKFLPNFNVDATQENIPPKTKPTPPSSDKIKILPLPIPLAQAKCETQPPTTGSPVNGEFCRNCFADINRNIKRLGSNLEQLVTSNSSFNSTVAQCCQKQEERNKKSKKALEDGLSSIAQAILSSRSDQGNYPQTLYSKGVSTK